MGKRIKSTGVILDASSTGSAPVSPSGTVALRAKSDSTQFQYSANGGAWTDFGGGGAGGAVTGKWLWSNVTTGAVATGVVAINNSDPSAATEIRIHETSNDATAFAASFDSVIPGSDIYVQDFDDATRWVRYTVTAPATDDGDYRHWPVTLDSYGGVNLNNGEVVSILFITAGSGSIPRLDQVLDPMANKTFAMSTYNLGFSWVGSGGSLSLNKYLDSQEPALLYFNRGRGTSASPTDLVGDDVAGAIAFQGRLSGSFTQLGYIRGWYDSTLGGRVDVGAGAVDQSRVAITETGSLGSVTLFGGATNYFQVQTAGFQFSHGTTGSIYYKNAAGYFVNLDILTSPSDVGKTLTVVDVSGTLLPQWAVAGGAPRLDQILDPTATKTFSMGTYQLGFSWAGSGGLLTLYKLVDSTEPPQINFKHERSTGYLLHDDLAGRIMFYGWFSPAYKALGYIQSTFNTTYGPAGTMTVGVGDFGNARIDMLQTDSGTGGVTIYGGAATPYFQVQTAGFQFSGSTNGAMWYTNSSGYFVPTASPAAADRIAFWDNSAGTVAWLEAGTGLTITGTVLTASGGGAATAGGTNLQVQYNNATALGGITGFEVSSTGGAPNMVLGGGYFQIAAGLTASVPNIDQEFFISATTAAATRFVMRCFRDITDGGYIQFDRSRGSQAAKTTLINDDTVGKFVFNGYWDSAARQSGYIRSWYDGTYGGGRLDLGAGAIDDFARITMLDTGSSAAITMFGSSSYYFQVQTAGYLFNGGANGTLWYTNSAGYFVPTSTPPAADRIAFWDASAGTVTWLTAGTGLTITGTTMTASGGGGGTPAGSGSELQYNSSMAFGAVNTSGVTAAGWVGIGTTTPGIRLHVVGGCVVEAASFIFQVQTAGFYFSSGSTGSVYYKDSFGYFVPTAAGTTSQYLKGGTAPSWGSIDATHITSGTLPLARGGTGSGMIDPNADRIMFWDDSAGAVDWLTAGTGLTITGTTITAAAATTPAGSGSELQYRNAGAFGAVASSSVDGSGGVVLGGGTLTVQGNASAVLAMKAAIASAGPTIYTERSRGTLTSKSGIFAGDALLTVSSYGYDSGVVIRQGVAMDFTAQATFTSTSAPTVLRLRTTPVNSIIPAGRMIVGACRTLPNNTLTDLFTITYGAADQSAMAGEIHIVLVAKGTITGGAHDGVNIFVHRRVISFAIAHNKNNDMQVTFTEVQAHRSGGASDDTGLTAISHALNADAAVGTGTNIPSTPNAYATNAITYKILATAVPNMTSVSQLTCYYNIFYHGEGELAVAAS